MDSLANSPGDKVEFHQMEDPPARASPKSTTIVLHGQEFWSLSGKPYFHIILLKSHLQNPFQVVMPAKIHSVLPPLVIPTSLTYMGKKWEMMYHGTQKYSKRIDCGWKKFAIDNNLKVGDACVFELMECSSQQLKFRVQILKSDIPAGLLCKMNGDSADTPIIIE